jgi:hypothetical protein
MADIPFLISPFGGVGMPDVVELIGPDKLPAR